MKTCRKCRTLVPSDAMMCRCGYSFVEKVSERPRVGAAKTGHFAWLFLGNCLAVTGIAWALSRRSVQEVNPELTRLGGYFLISGIPSLLVAIVLLVRQRIGYRWGMTLCWMNLASLPFGAVIALMMMRGLAIERHVFEE